MKDWEQEVLGHYEIDVTAMKKVRGGVFCESKQGIYLMSETKLSEKRLGMLENLYDHMKGKGFSNIDCIVRDRENALVCELEDGTRYILRSWFDGRECDVKRENELLSATKKLAKLHKMLRGAELESYKGEDAQQVFFRHNRELRKVRSFIRGKVDKGKFENAFLSHFENMYHWAEVALARLEESDYKKIPRSFIHGDYNYHNILMLHNGVATTNFEHFEENIQATDLYYFLRKTMEKHQWDIALGDKMLDYYQRFVTFSKEEVEYIGILLAYPEKFWKAANAYSRAKKSWIPAKSLEKLELVTWQMKEKEQFLRHLFGFQL